MPSYYEHENLLLEIHTSVRVVIMWQRVWGRSRRRVVIFMAEQEQDGGKENIFQKLKAGLGEIRRERSVGPAL